LQFQFSGAIFHLLTYDAYLPSFHGTADEMKLLISFWSVAHHWRPSNATEYLTMTDARD